MQNITDIGDLTQLAKDIETIIKAYLHLDQRPGIALALTMPPGFKDVHWITNLSRQSGIELFENTAAKMRSKPMPGIEKEGGESD